MKLSEDEVGEVFGVSRTIVRAALRGPRTARSAALRATPEDIALLRRHIAEEHAALASGRDGQALRLSGQFHLDIARIADQATVAEFIAQLISRSSLVIALYWPRRTAPCERHAHDALLKAMADHDGPLAEALMKAHLLDLLSSLDLRGAPARSRSLKEAPRRE